MLTYSSNFRRKKLKNGQIFVSKKNRYYLFFILNIWNIESKNKIDTENGDG